MSFFDNLVGGEVIKDDVVEEEKVKKFSPFDLIEDVGFKKENLVKKHGDVALKAYDPFLTNRAFSYHPDTILYAQEMNCATRLTKEMQYDFYSCCLSRQKRYGKWHKKDKEEEALLTDIKKYYGCDMQTAKNAVDILDKDAIAYIRQYAKLMS